MAWRGLGGTCSKDGRVKEVQGRTVSGENREHVAREMQWGAEGDIAVG